MAPKVRIALLIGLLILIGLGVLSFRLPLRASPGQPTGIDYERFAALKSRVDELRRQGYDVSRLETTISDVEYWIAQDKVFEANLRIADLEADLSDPRVWGAPPPLSPMVLPPAPPASPISDTGSHTLFQEDFASPEALNGWQGFPLSPSPDNTARWEIRQGALYLNMGGGSMEIVGMVNLLNQDWEDYVYSADIYAIGNQEVGVVFRCQGSNFYRFRFLSHEHTGNPTRFLEWVEGGKPMVLATADGPGYQPQRWYNVQIAARGPQITVYLDGQPILQATDYRSGRGRVGVFALSLGDVYFDNIRVSAVR